MSGWSLREARESCETVFDRAWNGEPQFIMRGQMPMVVVISYADYQSCRQKPVAWEEKKSETNTHATISLAEEFDALVRQGHDRLDRGAPYRFNRADAYPDGEFA